MIDVGETYSSPNYEVLDINGVLGNAGTVTASIILPDGSSPATPTVNNPSAGIYNFDYLTSIVGPHRGYLTATGGVLGTIVRKWPISFHVIQADHAFIVSLEEIRTHLNITGHSDDEELLNYLGAATRVIEARVGSVVRRTWTENYDGGSSHIRLRHRPVISITTVTESGVTVASTGYALDAQAGILTRISGYLLHTFTAGHRNVAVEYVVGQTIDLENKTLAAKMIVGHLWLSQRGGTIGPGGIPVETEFAPEIGLAIPSQALRLISAEVQIGVA